MTKKLPDYIHTEYFVSFYDATDDLIDSSDALKNKQEAMEYITNYNQELVYDYAVIYEHKPIERVEWEKKLVVKKL